MVTQQMNWVLLSYRLPREPSTPRIAVWRKLRRLGVAQIGDGLVALPADDRTVEHLEWIAEQVVEADGTAIVWTAAPTGRADHDQLVADLNAARDDEYEALMSEIEAPATEGAGAKGGDGSADPRTVARWRRQFRQIERRDYFGAENGERARLLLAQLTANPTDAWATAGAST